MIGRMILALALLGGAAGAAFSQDLQAAAREAEAQAKAGKHLAAVETMRRAITAMTAKGPLLLRNVQFITDVPRGFGAYQPRPKAEFKPGEPLLIYAEPVGIGWRTEGGINRAEIAVDFEIRRDNKVLGGKKDFGRFDFASREQNQEINTHLTITVSGAPAGRYVVAATYRDQVGGKSATLELPFEIK